MRTLLVALLAVAVGFLLARVWRGDGAARDPIQAMLLEVRTHALIEHERGIAVWYRSCPEVTGVNPEIFVAWPGKLSYELDLADVAIEREGEVIRVRTGPIRADEPAIPTDFVDWLTTKPWFNLANEEALVNAEVARASPIARYLSVYYERRDPTLSEAFRTELAELVRRLAGALGVPVSRVEVEIPESTTAFPKLPKLELCPGSMASVNGLAFAKTEDGYTIPIGFNTAKASAGDVRGIVTGVYPGDAGRASRAVRQPP
jgi:hypothetical protein